MRNDRCTKGDGLQDSLVEDSHLQMMVLQEYLVEAIHLFVFQHGQCLARVVPQLAPHQLTKLSMERRSTDQVQLSLLPAGQNIDGARRIRPHMLECAQKILPRYPRLCRPHEDWRLLKVRLRYIYQLSSIHIK